MGYVEADFIGGVLDGKTYAIPKNTPEWKVRVMRPLSFWKLSKTYPTRFYDVAVYKHILNGVYWLSRIEKGDD